MKSYFGLIAGCGVLLIVFLVWKPFSSKKTTSEVSVSEEHVQAPADTDEDVKKENVSAQAPPVAVPQETSAAPSEEVLKKNFSIVLQNLSSCLGLKGAAGSGLDMPTEVALLDAVRGELNDPVIQSEDWQTTRLFVSNAEEREIRISMDYENEDNVARVLKYNRLTQQNGQTIVTPIELPADQAQDPNDTFIASLEKDGTVKSREKANRLYYQSGEEFLLTEKNGVLADIEINRQGRSLKCKLGAESAPCNCQ